MCYGLQRTKRRLKNVPVRLRFHPLNAELNPIRHLLALVGARHIVHVSRIRVKCVTDCREQNAAIKRLTEKRSCQAKFSLMPFSWHDVLLKAIHASEFLELQLSEL